MTVDAKSSFGPWFAAPLHPLCSVATCALLFLCWAAFGFVHGFYWLVLLCYLREPRQKKLAGACFASIWIGVLVTALGGGWCRSGTSVDCPGGETMSRKCLWNEQRSAYQMIYTMHYIGLAWSFSQWVLDGLNLIFWCRVLTRGGHVVFFNSDIEFSFKRHAVMVCGATASVTLTWTCLFDWSTEDGLQTLAAVLFTEIVLVGLTAYVFVRAASAYAEFSKFMTGFSEEG